MNRKNLSVLFCVLVPVFLTGCGMSLKNTRSSAPGDADLAGIERDRTAVRQPFQVSDFPEGFWVWAGGMAVMVVVAVAMRPRSGEMRPHEG